MCGILLHIGGEEIRADHPALNIISHRGPDACGAKSFDFGSYRVGLGHRRLSIIDLSDNANQPMSYSNESIWITFNGEIYNYIEIRDELIADGFVFKSDSDTEVLLAAYQKWGVDCLDKLNGMFAFCIYDINANKIIIVRDRFGIKPLYFYNSSNGFTVASEVKQFTCFNDFDKKINYSKLYHFLNSGDFSFDNETLWDNVYELEPGHLIEIQLDKWSPGKFIEPKLWYRLDFYKTLNIDENDAILEFESLLKESVNLRLRSDVPLGFLLSGGLDSSTLVGLACGKDKSVSSLKTFSSCYKNSPLDESKFIKEVVDYTSSDSSLHYPKPKDILDNLGKVIWNSDNPIQLGSPISHWLIYEHIKNDNDGRKVILEGQGADEILGGYHDFLWAKLYENMNLLHLPLFLKELFAVQKKHHYKLRVWYTKFKRLTFPSIIKYPSNEVLSHRYLISDNKIPSIAIKRESPSVNDMHSARFTILRQILHNVDRNSMAHSRETRVPFLDHKLVEFCVNLPSHYKISGGSTKYIMRKSIHNIVPENVRLRVDKQGYSSPIKSWLKDDLKEMFMDSINSISDNMPYVNKHKLKINVDKYFKGKKRFDPVWWNIISTDKWMKIFNVS